MKLSDLDIIKPIILNEGVSLIDMLSECGGGKVVQGINTTSDVHVGEIKRQANKFKFKTDINGVPPISKTNGQIKR